MIPVWAVVAARGIEIYLGLGFAFSLAFVFVGIGRIDPAARGAGWGFRLLVLPGAAALWPLLAWRWARGVSRPPIEANAHRRLAGEGP
ncbi:MAG: hypothetical protein U0X73_01550 [Thermoanaerobaculia bacterium]